MDIARGMQYLMDNGIIHNRINPKNIFLRYKKENKYPIACISDFCNAMIPNDESYSKDGIFIAMQMYD
jgi:serine/threonine protein kinase